MHTQGYKEGLFLVIEVIGQGIYFRSRTYPFPGGYILFSAVPVQEMQAIVLARICSLRIHGICSGIGKIFYSVEHFPGIILNPDFPGRRNRFHIGTVDGNGMAYGNRRLVSYEYVAFYHQRTRAVLYFRSKGVYAGNGHQRKAESE